MLLIRSAVTVMWPSLGGRRSDNQAPAAGSRDNRASSTLEAIATAQSLTGQEATFDNHDLRPESRRSDCEYTLSRKGCFSPGGPRRAVTED